MNESSRSGPASKPDAWSATMLVGGLVLTILGAAWHFLSPHIKVGRKKPANRRPSL